MTIEELADAKRELESQIAKLVYQFSSNGVHVTYIDVRNILQGHSEVVSTIIDVTVELPPSWNI